jgi:mRNA interferase MazF
LRSAPRSGPPSNIGPVTQDHGEDTSPRLGDVYWVDFSPARGSEQAGKRPAVVISIDSLNRAMPVCTVAAITTSDKSKSKVCLALPEGQPCAKLSYVLPFQVMTLSQDRLLDWIGELTDAQKAELKARLRLVWDL